MLLPRLTASLWPGFPRAWVLGRWDGLVLAVAFGVALNVALVLTFSSGNPPSNATASMTWALVLGLWIVGLGLLRQDWSRLGSSDGIISTEQEVQFCESQHEYLKEHWLEAETSVMKILARQPLDVEARLLLASIQRRTGRWNEARTALVELRADARAAPWLLEIEMELRQIDKDRNDKDRGDEGRLSERSQAA